MRNLFKYLLIVISAITLNSCREDGDWGNNNSGVFGFTIDRDTDYIEKALGEANQLKFNIKTDYDFASVPMKFKYTTTLDGVLKLDGKELEANTEYTLTKADNVFEYIGKEAGEHKIKISVKNSKGNSATEEYALKYAISDFILNYQGGKGDYYQGQDIKYLFQLTPKGVSKDYQIKIIAYDEKDTELNYSKIRLNDGNPMLLQKWYPLNIIENFNITTTPYNHGTKKLVFIIKNSTTERRFEIEQTILARKIIVQSINLDKSDVVEDKKMSLRGIVTKTPFSENSKIFYKTWISTSSNNNSNGIENTQNVYQPYIMGSDNTFIYDFKGINIGTYTYNIQFKDEYGNESEVQKFEIKVNAKLQFVNDDVSVHFIEFWKKTSSKFPQANGSMGLKKIALNFIARAGGDKLISEIFTKVKIKNKNHYQRQEKELTRTFTIYPYVEVADYSSKDLLWEYDTKGDENAILKHGEIEEIEIYIKVITNDGSIIEKIIKPDISKISIAEY